MKNSYCQQECMSKGSAECQLPSLGENVQYVLGHTTTLLLQVGQAMAPMSGIHPAETLGPQNQAKEIRDQRNKRIEACILAHRNHTISQN